MTARVLVLRVDGVGERLGRFLEHLGFFLPRFLIEKEFAFLGVLRLRVDEVQGECVEHDHDERHGDRSQRDWEKAEQKYLRDRRDDRKRDAGEKYDGKTAHKSLAVLNDDHFV